MTEMLKHVRLACSSSDSMTLQNRRINPWHHKPLGLYVSRRACSPSRRQRLPSTQSQTDTTHMISTELRRIKFEYTSTESTDINNKINTSVDKLESIQTQHSSDKQTHTRMCTYAYACKILRTHVPMCGVWDWCAVAKLGIGVLGRMIRIVLRRRRRRPSLFFVLPFLLVQRVDERCLQISRSSSNQAMLQCSHDALPLLDVDDGSRLRAGGDPDIDLLPWRTTTIRRSVCSKLNIVSCPHATTITIANSDTAKAIHNINTEWFSTNKLKFAI